MWVFLFVLFWCDTSKPRKKEKIQGGRGAGGEGPRVRNAEFLNIHILLIFKKYMLMTNIFSKKYTLMAKIHIVLKVEQ